MQFDFVGIGDVVTDAFIKLADDNAEVIKGVHQKICLNHPDKIPFERAVVVKGVGNAANACVSASRLGLAAAFVSNVGEDTLGQEMIQHFKDEGVNADNIIVNKNKTSNNHYVLWYKTDRTILIHHEKYVYHLPSFEEPPKWFYFSSIGEDAVDFHDVVSEYIEQNPETKLAFQPGTFQIRLGPKKLARIYKNTEVFFCNREEAMEITGIEDREIEGLVRAMHSYGPRMVILTDGPDGAYASDGKQIFFLPQYPDPVPPLERTGAGDSFSSTVISSLALGNSLKTALMWGPVNSMSVVQHIGAQEGLLRRTKLEQYLEAAPPDYKSTIYKKL